MALHKKLDFLCRKMKRSMRLDEMEMVKCRFSCACFFLFVNRFRKSRVGFLIFDCLCDSYYSIPQVVGQF